MKNKFYDDIQTAYNNKASILQLKELLGRGRAKKGMFEGDLIEGELEIGQIASSITQVKPAARIVNEIWIDFKASIKKLGSLTD